MSNSNHWNAENLQSTRLSEVAAKVNEPKSSHDEPHILLIQARQKDDPIREHEFECFVARTPVSREAFTVVNMAESTVSDELLDTIDVVTVGGAGDFSCVEQDYCWHDDLLELMRTIVEREIPMFASCFGFHALVQAFGGELVSDPERGEIGTHEIRLTEQGRQDPVFGGLPRQFDAQLGHKDSVVELPEEFIRLAASDRCAIQAVRVASRPIYATQFHPELTADENIDRYVRYLENYKKMEESREEALDRAERIHRPSPEANELFGRFIEGLFGSESNDQ